MKYNQTTFIIACNIKHNNKYDYSKTFFLNLEDKIVIVCPIHGEFNQKADNHLRANGCPQCGGHKYQTENAKLKWNSIINDGYMTCICCKQYKPLIQFKEKFSFKKYRKFESRCLNCFRSLILDNKVKNNSLDTRLKELMLGVKRRSKKFNIIYDINIDFLKTLWIKQNGKCYYTGLPLDLEHIKFVKNHDKISIDRIDSNLGYIKGNIVLTKSIVNIMKNELSLENFYKFIKEIYNYKFGVN